MNQILDKLKQYPVAVLAVLSILVCVGAIVTRGSAVDELTTQEDELSSRLRTISANAKNSKDLEADVVALDAYVGAINERLFDRDERSINTDFFYSFEDDLEILISDVKQIDGVDAALSKGGPHELKMYSAISYDVKVVGSFREILAFLHEVHSVDALLRVGAFEVSSADGTEGTARKLAAKLNIVALAAKE